MTTVIAVFEAPGLLNCCLLYIKNLGFTGVHIIFLNILLTTLGVRIKTALMRLVKQVFLNPKKKFVTRFHLKIVIFKQ